MSPSLDRGRVAFARLVSRLAALARPGLLMGRTCVTALSAAAIAAVGTADAGSIEGAWLTADRSATVEIVRCDVGECGLIAVDPDHRTSFAGRRIIEGLRPISSNIWAGGFVYDPRNGRRYASWARLLRDGNLRIEGCLAFLCSGQTWTRVPGR